MRSGPPWLVAAIAVALAAPAAAAPSVEWRDASPRSPAPRGSHGLAYDTDRGVTLLFGGQGSGSKRQDVWEWDGETGAWREVTPIVPPHPPARTEPLFVWDPARGEALLFGGDGSSKLSDTWRWRSASRSWEQVAGAGPSGTSDTGAAWDAATGHIVLYGGLINGAGLKGRTRSVWQWDGDAWVQQGFGPYFVRGHAMGSLPGFGTCSFLGWAATAAGDVDGYASVHSYDAVQDVWTELVPSGLHPTMRRDFALAWDPARQVAVVFGGNTYANNGVSLNQDHWEWDPASDTWSAWTTPGPRPAARHLSPAALDVARERVVLFGGLDASGGLFGDTWEWDGAAGAWIDRTPQSPPARSDAALAWVGDGGRPLLFGGVGAGGALADAWTWTGGTWEPAPSGPAARSGHTLTAFDGGALLLGGRGADGAPRADAFTFDGAWAPLPDAPVARADHAAAWVGSLGVVLVHGGEGAAGLLGDAHTIDASGFSPAAAGPGARARHAMAWDPARDRVVLFGGDDGGLLGDTWEWDPATGTWTEPPASPSPAARAGASLTWHADLGGVVLVGGEGAAGPLADAWLWTGAWTPLSSILPGPPARAGHAAAWGDDAVVVFGGEDGDLLGDTWTLATTPCLGVADCPLDAECDAAVACVDGACVYSPSEGKPCTDGSLCTEQDACTAGACVGVPVDCDDGDACTADACAPATGCSNTHAVLPCDDGDPCTTGDVCQAGACAGVAIACDDGDACTKDTCEAGTGACTHSEIPEGFACNDGLACSATSSCQSGVCKGWGCPPCETAADCDDGDPCTAHECFGGACVTVSGAFNQSIGEAGTQIGDDLAPMADGGYALGGHTATGLGGDDARIVRLSAARAKLWEVAFGGPGDDSVTGLLALGDGSVVASISVAAPGGPVGWLVRWDAAGTRRWAVPLPDGMVPVRRPALADPGVIVVAAAAGGTVRLAGVSQDGAVLWTKAEELVPGGSVTCHVAGSGKGRAAIGTSAGLLLVDGDGTTELALAGTTVYVPAPRPGGWYLAVAGKIVRTDEAFVTTWSTAFNGEDVNDLGATADGGFAVSLWIQARRYRADGTQVWIHSKNGKYGPNRDRLIVMPDDSVLIGDHEYSSQASKDSHWLARVGTWGGTSCEPCAGVPLGGCDDGNVCTTDACAPGTGCTHTPVGGACDDGSACTEGDACASGACVGLPHVCNDGDPCTDDGCDPATGSCTVAPSADGAACEDDLACTDTTSCQGGACVGTSLCAACATDADCATADPCSLGGCFSGYCAEVPRTGTVALDYRVTSIEELHDGTLLVATGRDLVRLAHDGTEIWRKDTTNTQSYRFGVQLADRGVLAVSEPLFARRYTVGGDLLWERSVSPTGTGVAGGIVPTPDGGAIVVGQTDTAAGGVWLGRIDVDGDPVWSEEHLPTGATTARANAVVPLPDGSFVVAAHTGAPTTAWLARFDKTGDLLDDALVAVEGQRTVLYGVSPAPDGGFVGVGMVAPEGTEAWDAWIVRFDAALAVQWTRTFGTKERDELHGVAITSEGDIVWAGHAREKTLSTVAKLMWGRLSPTGDLLWSRVYDKPGFSDEGWVARTLGGGGVVIGGLVNHSDGFVWRIDDFGATTCDGASACAGLTPADCDDGDACTTDDCDPVLGCVHAPTTDACDDGDPCTTAVCVPGSGCAQKQMVCKDDDPCTIDLDCDGGTCPKQPNTCDDGDICTSDWCDALFGCMHQGCNDGDPCTTDGCDPASGCVNLPVTCDDGNPCTTDACDGGAGGCTNVAEPLPCDDGDPCTAGDTCAAGACLSGAPLDCDDGDPCTGDSCGALGCAHVVVDGPCDDGDACTVNDACSGGECVPGAGAVCDDASPCTADACDPEIGCTFTAQEGACSDGDPCTGPDVCAGGVCVPGGPLSCDDGDPCTTDACTPGVGCAHAPTWAPCDDGDPCTADDVCAPGGCAGIASQPCGDGDPCTADTCDGAGGCLHTPVDGPCSDGDACTAGDACAGGACVGVAPLGCDDGNPCTTDSCDPATGCTHAPAAGPCDDGNACTAGDSCQGGTCAAGPGTVCDDGSVCTEDSCDPDTGCVFAPVEGPCDDGDPCTAGDACQGGACVGGGPTACDDGNPCTEDACEGGCVHVPVAGPCSDGDECTVDDACEGGLCAGTGGLDCDDGNPCTKDSCTLQSGCVHAPASGPCDDGDPCTSGDACEGGLCVPGAATDCGDGNPCTDDACVAGVGCESVPADGPCEDGNACTVGDACAAGACEPGAGAACDDDEACTDDSCDPDTGCVFAPVQGACDDGDPCTTGDACADGACVGGATLCDDGNPCTDDGCEPGVGCEAYPNTAPCEDGNACTAGDTCAGGDCVSGPGTTCDDGNPCTADSCDPDTGCHHAPQGGTCDDGDECTVGDSCDAGACVPGAPADCDDGNPCTEDACAAGCVHVAAPGPCDDGNPCTDGDVCIDGACKSGVGPSCDDDNPCTEDTCTLADGCAHAPVDGGCDDGDPCTTPDVCAGGACVAGPVDCDDGNPCTADACDGGCTHTPAPGPCEDGSACTTGDACEGGACVSGPGPDCTDDDPCTDEACDPEAGCVYTPNAAPCDDGDPCTLGDQCDGGLCAPGGPNPCDDGEPCTEGLCTADGCVFAPLDGPCDDGDPCTVGEACEEGACVGGDGPDCDDGDPCTEDSCNAELACVHAAAPDGTHCDDGVLCNGPEACADGACAPEPGDPCDDGDPCTEDSCDEANGCAHAKIDGCCTTQDDCVSDSPCVVLTCVTPGAACESQTKLDCCTADADCDDGNPCTVGSCAVADGTCSQVPVEGCCTADADCAAGPCEVATCTAANACTVEAVEGCCVTSADCAAGTCVEGECVTGGEDAGTGGDAGGADAGGTDAGAADSGSTGPGGVDTGGTSPGEDGAGSASDGSGVGTLDALGDASDDGGASPDDGCTATPGPGSPLVLLALALLLAARRRPATRADHR